MPTQEKKGIVERPPIVVVMGHIDHGKSTLLDYIRKTNIVDKEAGGITQNISAYEVDHKDEKGQEKKITFLDTPGHEAFSKMRERGAGVADIAILVVSAEDSVKTQTIEAWNTIKAAKIPCVVAINKIDRPGANIEKTKMDLIEKEIYLEGFGGDIPFVPISAKTGEGIDQLLSTILLVAELAEFKGDESRNASGIIIESKIDIKRGISATLVIQDGALSKGMFVVAEDALAGTRILENFLGVQIDKAAFSSPVRIVGWNKIPNVGATFESFASKKEAEESVKKNSAGVKANKDAASKIASGMFTEETKLVPLIIKTDVLGTVEAIEKEISKLSSPAVAFKIIQKGAGAIGEADVRLAGSDKEAIIVGFNVKTDGSALNLNEQLGVPIHTFDIIYKLTDWLKEELEKRRPRIETLETTGKVKILKVFSKTKDRQVVGGKVTEGGLKSGGIVRILRRDFEIGKGKLIGLEQGKVKTGEVLEGAEFGMLLETKTDIAPGDIIEAFITVQK